MVMRKKQNSRQKAYEPAMRRALARKPFLNSDGKYLSREEAHDREVLRKQK